MSDFMLMEPANRTFGELFGNGLKYVVPRFQRDYAWDQEQWEDLWADIETLEEEHCHYMGYIVLQKNGYSDFEVIDGQQRLVTLSLVVLAAMRKIRDLIEKHIEEEANQERLSVFYDRLIGAKNTITLKVDNKLSLNRNNNRHFREICSNINILNERGLTRTNVLLNDAFKFFSGKVAGDNGTRLAQFIELLISRMIFTKIVVQDSLNAYKIFETLNARGVQLSTPDLLKNYIFSVITSNDDVTDEHLNVLDEDWATIIAQLGENNFTDFVRYHHNFQKKIISKKGLFKSIKELADTPQSASLYISSLNEHASIYAALLNPYDEWWKRENNAYQRIRHYLEGLKLFGVKLPFTVFLVAFKKFSSDEFLKTLKYLYVISIRYNVICRHSPNEQEKAYNKIAMKIFKGDLKKAGHIKNCDEFKLIYPDDNTFKNAFEFYKMPSRCSSKKIRFLLTEIENSFGRELDYLNTILEHVCPYNPEQSWNKNFGEGVTDIADRFGNMVLLEKDELSRADFNKKKETYLASSFRLAKKVAEYDSWNLQNLNRYQVWLAEQAAKTWRVD